MSIKVIRAQSGFQEKFVRTNVDFAVGGGALNVGKTFAAVLSIAESVTDENFRGLFLRNNLGDAKASGGVLDTFKEVFGNYCQVVESGDPHVNFPSGARVDVTHVADQSKTKLMQRFKGRQYDFVYFDEGTGFTWECFTTIYTRNRGKANWTGKMRMTTNPDKNHWLRDFIDWYIGIDGKIIPERNGVVRYFFINGKDVRDVVWGDTKEEVYEKCKIAINSKLSGVGVDNGLADWRDFIKSFTYYQGKMSENKASLQNNKGYVGSIAVSGEKESQQLLEGNWNVSPDEEDDIPIPSRNAMFVSENDPQINNDKWITCDLADTGTDNFVALVWNGFHLIDILILKKSLPRMNAEMLENLAIKHSISNNHIIYDAIRGIYINDYIPDAQPFYSYRKPFGMYWRMARTLKDECYLRLVEVLKNGMLSFDESVAQKTYEHSNLKTKISVMTEFVEECSVVRFRTVQSGKKTLYTKKEMNSSLGKNRSMDLLDPIAMRMMPVLQYQYGEELHESSVYENNEEYDRRLGNSFDIYDESNWY